MFGSKFQPGAWSEVGAILSHKAGGAPVNIFLDRATEMAIAGGLGAALDVAPRDAHAFWFGEEQGRYVVTTSASAAEGLIARAHAAGVPAQRLGTTGGDALTPKGERPILVAKLRDSFEAWFPAYMGGGGA